MKISDGVEWSAHACAILACLPEGAALSASALADFHALPKAYLAKHLQALARAGVVMSVKGSGGGYRLAKPAGELTMLDIRFAIEGSSPDFRCREIRRNGPCGLREANAPPCSIAAAFWKAEEAYRTALNAVTVADVVSIIGSSATPERTRFFVSWLTSVS